MKGFNNIIDKRDVIIVGVVLFIMMIVGSVWDYPISLALHNESNLFGIFFAAYGGAPAMLGFVMSGTLLLSGHNRDHKHIGILQMISGVLLILLGGAMLLMLPRGYINLSQTIIAAIGIPIMAVVVFLSVRTCRHADRSDIIKVAAVVFAVILLETILVNIIKIPWGRPRMRLISSSSEAVFIPWWVINGSPKQKLIATGIAGDEFKSFPSGHTANATVLILLCLLPVLNNTLRQRARIFFYVGVAWGGMVALSRIIIGAHFVTDTVAGFSVTLIITLIMLKLTFSNNVSQNRRDISIKSSSKAGRK